MDNEALTKLIKEENEKTRRDFAEKSAETQRHFDVVAEGLRSDIAKIGEGVLANTERLDRVDGKLDKMEGRFDRLEMKVEVLDQKVEVLDQKVEVLDQKVEALDHKLDAFVLETRTNFEEVRASIKFSYAELDRRLTFLESGFKDLSSRMASLEGRRTQ